jgi:peptide/nickel transport system substrate-binding protein
MALLNRSTKLRLRRIIRRRQKQVEAVAEEFDANLIGRFDRFVRIRRFAIGWFALIALLTFSTIVQTLNLSAYYQTSKPVSGGMYNEGMVGTYTNANPIYATGSVDQAVSRLIFSGLLKYNNQNKLVPDLASSYSVDATGKQYMFRLKPNLTWQDGQPLTAEDVAFTYNLIQNPDVGSPFLQSWQNINISVPNNLTVIFNLPNTYAAFPYSLTSGILPKHILANVPASQIRSNNFNTTDPIGSGPFAWQAIQASIGTDPSKTLSLIALKPFDHYVSGQPKLDGFVLHVFGGQSAMLQAFQRREINAMAGLNNVPSTVSKDSDANVTSFSSTAALMTFFKTSDGVLADTQVRKALIEGADTSYIINQLGYVTLPVKEPLLLGQLAYNKGYQQPAYSPAAANATLDSDGWVRGSNGLRTKAGQPLSFSLYAEDTPENEQTVKILSRNWRALGVQMTPVLQSPTDFQSTVEFHTYDALLYGISIGVDPDVFPYWDSSQADIRSTSQLNFSEYKSSTADASLEAGRTRLDPALRVIKYQPFLQAWQSDSPALGLYQPRILYITHGPVYGLTDHTLNTDSDRYNSVSDWEILSAKVTDN